MSWQGIEGHDAVGEQFRRALERGRLASTFLFVGPAGVGKRLFAEKLAQALLCQQSPEAALAPCGACDSCVQVASRTHPDLMIVEKPRDKSFIPLDVLVGEKERRMREGLCHDIALKPFMGGRKVAIIDDADDLNEEGANALLKTLEEPPPQSVLILIGTSADRQLPTIRSRCQLIRFRPLEPALVAAILQARGLVADAPQAERLAKFADGSIQRAMELADDDLWNFRRELLESLSCAPLESVKLAQAMVAFVDAAGKEAPPRRARMRQTIGFAADFYRQWLRALAGLEVAADPELAKAVARAHDAAACDSQSIAACIESTHAARV
ncbi:MAG: DNA polymerase III subunit delta', partial [Pirellulales bacterium]